MATNIILLTPAIQCAIMPHKPDPNTMQPATTPNIQIILFQAESLPGGLVLRTNDPERLRAKLYAVKKELQDSRLDNLQFTINLPEKGNVVISKKPLKEAKQLTKKGIEKIEDLFR